MTAYQAVASQNWIPKDALCLLPGQVENMVVQNQSLNRYASDLPDWTITYFYWISMIFIFFPFFLFFFFSLVFFSGARVSRQISKLPLNLSTPISPHKFCTPTSVYSLNEFFETIWEKSLWWSFYSFSYLSIEYELWCSWTMLRWDKLGKISSLWQNPKVVFGKWDRMSSSCIGRDTIAYCRVAPTPCFKVRLSAQLFQMKIKFVFTRNIFALDCFSSHRPCQ